MVRWVCGHILWGHPSIHPFLVGPQTVTWGYRDSDPLPSPRECQERGTAKGWVRPQLVRWGFREQCQQRGTNSSAQQETEALSKSGYPVTPQKLRGWRLIPDTSNSVSGTVPNMARSQFYRDWHSGCALTQGDSGTRWERSAWFCAQALEWDGQTCVQILLDPFLALWLWVNYLISLILSFHT